MRLRGSSMRSKPYEAQHLKEAHEYLDARARYLQEILEKKEKSRPKKKGLLSRLMGWFS